MSVTLMAASCDSIGSCSLDVDAESLNGSLIDSAQVDSSHNHRNSGEHQANAPSLSKQTLHSLLLSAGTSSGGPGPISDNLDHPQANLSSPSATAKKPSYLNLACSISGYGGITTYDSKLREGFRSRDQSPGKLIAIQSGSREASPARGCGNLLAPPHSGRLCWTPSPVGGQAIQSDMKHISPTIGGVQRFNGTNGSDQTDATGNFGEKRILDQRNRWLESTLSPLEKDKDYQQVVTVFESKTGRHGTETAVETRCEVNSRSRSTVVSSKTVISSSSLPQHYTSTVRSERITSIEGGSLSDKNGHISGKPLYTNGSTSLHTPVSSKSFIQQRVERLYGPCALAQGFFHRSVKSSFSLSCNSPGGNRVSSPTRDEVKSSPEKSEGSPELPVLRHLRPEFREQLTVAPRRSFGSKVSNGSAPTNSPASKSSSVSMQGEYAGNAQQIQRKTSTESLADLQPAAPEVVLPQQSLSISPATKADDKCMESKESGSIDAENVSLSQVSESVESHEEKTFPTIPTVSCGEPKVDEVKENAGHRFLKIQRQTIEKLLELAESAEQEIESDGLLAQPVLTEEALGHLRAAAGQARLLVTQKMVQFEGLCRKCINQHPEEPFPTTAEDLQGFWDMLLLQVDQVHNTFRRLEKLKAVGWCEEKLTAEDHLKATDLTGVRTPISASKRTPRSSKVSSTTSAKSAEAVALRKQREEERRKIMEQRRKELKQKQQSGGNSSDSKETVEIFGAQPS